MYRLQKISLCLLLMTGNISNANAQQYTFEQLMSFGVRSDEKGEYPAAIASLDQAVELKPEDDMAWVTRGIVRVHMRDFGSAVVDFNKAIFLNPNRIPTYLYRFIAYKETENFQFALSDVNRYLQATPEDTFARGQRMQLSLMLAEYEVFQSDVRWMYAKIGDVLFESYGAVFLNHFEKNKQFSVLYKQLLMGLGGSNAISSQLRNQQILASFNAEDYQICLELLQLQLVQFPQNTILLKYKADALFYLNKISEAEELYGTLLKIVPSDADLMADYGHCLLQLEKWNDADAWLSKSIKSKNNSPAYAYLGRGIARYNVGKVGLACVDWQRSYLLGEKTAKKWLEIHCQDK